MKLKRRKNLKEAKKKKIFAIELVFLLLLSSLAGYFVYNKFQNIPPQPSQGISKEENHIVKKVDPLTENITRMILQTDESILLNYLQKIVSFGPHFTRSKTCNEVSNYIYKEFKSMDLEVRYHNWKKWKQFFTKPLGQWGLFKGKNIEAKLPGKDKYSDEIYIIYAHYDTVRLSPGADDDSSGVATILTIAKIMSQHTFNHTLYFVLFSGEEQSLFGSSKYVEECYKQNKNIGAGINIEQFGNVKTKEGSNKISITDNKASNWITNLVINISQNYSEYIHLEVIPIKWTKQHTSDFLSFWDFGYNSIVCFEYEGSDYTHSCKDTIEHVNVPYLLKGTKLMLATLTMLASG